VLAVAGVGTAGCGAGPAVSSGSAGSAGRIDAVGAENQYADVIGQIGGQWVQVTSILDNPNTDPHTFEASPSVAREVSRARLIVQNGLGYDDFMGKIESAAPSSARSVIVASRLLGLPDDTPNPHLWYDPTTMPAVARAVASDLSTLEPSHAQDFASNLARFDASLRPWLDALTSFKAHWAGTPVAVTEPVADLLLQAMGTDLVTPFRFQAAVMNGTDPTPQDIAAQQDLLSRHEVKLLCYNQQVVDELTTSLLDRAKHDGVPVVGVYETMPTPGFTYQSWMLAEVEAFQRAVAQGTSTERL
jgi:zinc/manganese transport system substrate-binding protein